MRALLLASVVALGWAGAARADVISTFQASGTFIDGATLGGTLTIDTTTGSPITEALTTSAPIQDTFDVPVFAVYQKAYKTFYVYVDDPAGREQLALSVPGTSLVGYDGSVIYSDTVPSPGGYGSGYTNGTNTVSLLSGSLTAVPGSLTAVPEPATLALLALPLGLLGLVTTRRRRAATAA